MLLRFWESTNAFSSQLALVLIGLHELIYHM